MAYRITYTEKGSIIDCSGIFSMQDIIDANGALHCYIKYSEHTYQIWNVLNAELAQITEGEMDEAVVMEGTSEILAPNMKIALVVRVDDSVKLCEAYRMKIEQYSSKWKCQLFETVDDAEGWAVK